MVYDGYMVWYMMGIWYGCDDYMVRYMVWFMKCIWYSL